MEELKLDQESYENYLKEIELVEKKLNEVRKYKGEVAIFQGDNWHDNPTLYATESEERVLMKKLYEIREQLKYISLIEKGTDDNIVDIGDTVVISFVEDGEIFDKMEVKLVGITTSFNTGSSEVSLNSPLGEAIYKKEIGDTVCYKVNDNNFNIVIEEKVK